MTAPLLHQFAAEGRLGLDRPGQRPLPAIPLPAGQHDHGPAPARPRRRDCPTTRRLFPPGGLWTAYAPGAHWHYSNTGYEILGKLAEHVGGKPLAQLLEERIFVPLGMSRTRGAIIGADRTLYAQGYEAADQIGGVRARASRSRRRRGST